MLLDISGATQYGAGTVPSINLRLTEQELAELQTWATFGHRSIQKEIIWRLFAAEGHAAAKIGPATDEPREAIEVPPGETAVLAAPKRKRMYPCKHHLPPSKRCPYGCDDETGA